MSARKRVLYEQLMDLRHAQSEATTPQARQAIQEQIKRLQREIDSID